ncbi:MAG TPA: sodium:proton antiporter [Methanothrix sp.]|nr:sodium:proton antiporter [Methanothrix sp.]
MDQIPLMELAGIIIIGISAQWIAWRLKLPSILLLMVFGFVSGPLTGFLHPDQLFGPLLSPFISISLALILFEGGLSLRVADLMGTKIVVRNLLTIGVLTTWILASVFAYIFLGLNPLLSVLLGSILVVTGPTVITPLLLYLRPQGRVGSIIKWEGIMNDPIGAILAIIVLDGILASGPHEAALTAVLGFAMTLIAGCSLGFFGALVIIKVMKDYLAPDRLLEVVSLMLVVLVFAISELIQEESGLLAATLMGVALANQNKVNIAPIIKFKEDLRTLLISLLFVILVARLPLNYFDNINLNTLIFLGSLIFIARPAAVILSTYQLDLNWREKVFIAWMAPRGIVAAAVASVFGLFLSEQGMHQAEMLAPVAFFVVAGTVAIYGLTAGPLARTLNLASGNQTGFLIAGAHLWARKIASIIRDQGLSVLLVDTNCTEIAKAYEEGLPTYHGSIISESILDEIDISNLGHLLALTSDDMINSLSAVRFRDIFGRKEVYQIRLETAGVRGMQTIAPEHLRGRFLFSPKITYSYLDEKLKSGGSLVVNEFTENFKYDPIVPFHDANTIPLMLISSKGSVNFFTEDYTPIPCAGEKLVSMYCPKNAHVYKQ